MNSYAEESAGVETLLHNKLKTYGNCPLHENYPLYGICPLYENSPLHLQVTEPGTLIPMVLGASQLVLVGDYKQLGPCVTPLGQQGGLDMSLFERLLGSGIPAHMLNVQYRMHPDIARWPSNHYYEGRLLNGGNTLTPKGVQTILRSAMTL